jgi:para-nitrobenzyl esterase
MADKSSFEINRRGFMAGTATVAGASVLASSLPMRAAFAIDSFEQGPVVETAYGKLKGLVDRDVNIFRGIRYGADTSGLNRFLAPKAPPSWTGVAEAFQFGPIAPQFDPGKPRQNNPFFPIEPANLPENEDCLRLNVYSKNLDRNAKQPVMVWYHGGGFTSGAASMPMYHAENLARKGDVVVVTVNHRLNVFGFTNLGQLLDREFTTSGNSGMLDAVAVLKWVNQNIEGFGGDPANVTIFGESGGGGKVSMLLAMPDAKGLFHRAVIESGPGVRFGSAEGGAKAAAMLLKELNIPESSARNIQQVPMKDVLSAYFAVLPKIGGGGLGGGGFGPIMDGVSLPRQPFAPDATDVSADVPVMIGTNHDEGTIFLGGAFAAEDLYTFKLPQNLMNMDEAGLKQMASRVHGVDAEKLIKTYRKDNPKATPWEIAVAMQTDAMMRINSILIAERKAAQGKAAVFMYRFDHPTDKLGGGHMGATHTVEVPMVFGTLKKVPWLWNDTPENEALSDTMIKTWSAFAKNGNPNNSALPNWPAYNAKTRETMILNVTSKVEKDPGGAERKLLSQVMA